MKKFKSKDKTENYSFQELHKLSKFAFNYCKENLGYNNRKKNALKYKFDRNKKFDACYGWYDPRTNVITLKLNNLENLKEFIKTFVHEYTHSLQPCGTHYFKLLKKHGYDKHPYEIEARSNEFLFKKILKEFRKEFGHKK